MRDAKFISIFVLLVILITLLIFTLWCVVMPEDVKDTVGIFRKRREQSPWMEQMMEKSENRSLQKTSEKVLLTALGQLKVSGPEDVMTFITQDSPCRNLKPFLKTFERHRKDVSDNTLFVRLFKAIKMFNFVYCGRDERYQKLFLKWQNELWNLHENFEDCQGAPDWYENINSTLRCQDGREIMKCFEEALKMEIGDEVANAWKCIFKAVVNEAMIQPCNFTGIKINDNVIGSGWPSKWLVAMTILFVTVAVIGGIVYGFIKYRK